MSDEDVEKIPFCDIALAMSTNSHTRRMAGAVLALFPGIKGREEITEECASPEFANFLASTDDTEVHSMLICRGLLPQNKVLEYANKADHFGNTAMTAFGSPLLDRVFATTMFALGSPLLPKSRVDALVAQYPATPDNNIHCAISNALLGNKAVHDGLGSLSPTNANEHYFFLNAAWFGALGNSPVDRALVMMISDIQSPGRMKTANALISRGKITTSLACALDAIPDLSVEEYRRLTTVPAHRCLVGDGKVTAYREFDDRALRKSTYVISPVATTQDIRLLSNKCVAGSSKQAALLHAVNCPREVYDKVIREHTKATSTYDFCRLSPWAERSLTITAEPWSWIKHLLKCNSDKALRLLALQPVPVAGISPHSLQEHFSDSKPLQAAAAIIGACRSQIFFNAMGQIGDSPEGDIAFLFSPKTSGRKLEKLAAIHPDLAGLAAIHPNGSDIPLSCIPSHHKDLVEASRHTSRLVGRTGALSFDSPGRIIV